MNSETACVQVKEHPILFSAPMVLALLADRKLVTRRLSKRWLKVKAGDRLWVRENFALPHVDLIEGCTDEMKRPMLCFQADGAGSPASRYDGDHATCYPNAWKPSIHMPRWASRILLECEEDARLERLQDMTPDEARMEGIERSAENVLYRNYSASERFADWTVSPIESFASLWRSLHTKPGERYEDNPEVVRVGRFHRVAKETV